jgi:hypothetical protein
MINGRCRMHGGASPGAPKGNQNALKHGRYTAEAIARRREISALIRIARALESTRLDGRELSNLAVSSGVTANRDELVAPIELRSSSVCNERLATRDISRRITPKSP